MSEQLIALLNKALGDEYHAAMQYLHHYNNVRSKHSDVVDHFKAHMEDEQDHANRLCARIYILGGTPSINIEPVAAFTEDIDEALKQDIIGEQEAIDLYSEIIAVCEQMGDRGTQVLIEDILTDEVGHIDEFAKIRRSTVSRS
jgi:bacterioferritin